MKPRIFSSTLILMLIAQNLFANSAHVHESGHEASQQPHVHLSSGYHHPHDGHHHPHGTDHHSSGPEPSSSETVIIVDDWIGILSSQYFGGEQLEILHARDVEYWHKTSSIKPIHSKQPALPPTRPIYQQNCALIL